MEKAIVRVKISNEVDIVLAHKRAKQMAEMTGLNFAEQARFSAAVSEISRNTIEHAEGGDISFFVKEIPGGLSLNAVVEDKGKGIGNVEDVLKSSFVRRGKGVGIRSSKKLVDFFDIDSASGMGTRVNLGMKLPCNHPPINPAILKGWREYFENELPVSPYEELKRQNDELIETLEQLKYKNMLIENQLEEIKRLNVELQKQNEEVRKLSREKEEQNFQLREKNNQLDEFAHIVSHDLKAPLNNMSGLLEIFREETGGENGEQELNMFEGQVLKMKKMIENILTYARAGKEGVEKSDVDLSHLFQEIAPALPQKPGISVEFPGEVPVIRTEEIYLHQIFSNLIGNAVKHHDKEQGHVRVAFQKKRKGLCEFAVSDDGPGIEAGKKEKIFELFHTIKTNKTIYSTGIGLSIVKKIVEMKGGKIWIEDNHPRGSRFIFTWPYEEVSPSPISTDSPFNKSE